MSYREKLAWLSLIAMALTFGPYFAVAGRASAMYRPMPNLHLLWLFAIAAGVQVVIQGFGRLWLRHKEQLEVFSQRMNAIVRSSTARFVPLTAS
jgi:hypothetical protein